MKALKIYEVLLNESIFKPVDLRDVFKDTKYSDENTREYVNDIYKLVNINNKFFNPMSRSEFVNDEYIINLIAKAFAKNENPYEPAIKIQKYLKDNGYHIKTIEESSIFKPKTEEEIFDNLKNSIEIENPEDATKHLRAAILRGNVPYAKYALQNGAKVIDNENSGNIWIAFHDNNEASEDIIIEMLKYSENRFKTTDHFKEFVLAKTIYMAYFKVLD